MKHVLQEVSLVGNSFCLVFTLSMCLVVMEMSLIDKPIWSKICTFAFCFAMLEVPDIERAIRLVHFADAVGVLVMLNRKINTSSSSPSYIYSPNLRTLNTPLSSSAK